eukprot:2845847-Rhodomonas_salina.1
MYVDKDRQDCKVMRLEQAVKEATRRRDVAERQRAVAERQRDDEKRQRDDEKRRRGDAEDL